MVPLRNGDGVMADGLNERIVQDFTQDIASKLGEAAMVANSASELGAKGLSDRSFQTLLEIEPLIFHARVLMNAASIVRQRYRARDDF
jgi:hypothetical protein